MISGAHHFAIKVRNLVECERFYTQVLGLSVGRRWPADSGGGDRSVWLGLGDDTGAFLVLETVAGGGGESPGDDASAEATREDSGPGLHLLAMRIRSDERTSWEERLARAGVAIVHRTAYTIYFHDPEGNRLGLSHHPDPRPPPTTPPSTPSPTTTTTTTTD